ncbi:two-component system response regulator YesN [Paenibacillus castaneae]|uniref:response regulator n=1 Tax=Paenibacillus castaneae TaxID=474957 RepID=UPI000C99B02F|nr:response regulator [Paenibacillus castaneae]NIK75428.1 two-component system response regulator YesN [Paenibacillus castaneae]
MWRLLIADDEPKIRRGLSKVLPWQELGIELVGEAENGLQALELAAERKPHILFVDICMPFVDGLEFIERLQQTLENSIVIVISGHDEFRYAQQAVKLHVFEYMLKPVVKSKLESVVRKAIGELELARDKEQKMEWMDQQLKTNSVSIRDAFLLKWLEGIAAVEEIHSQTAFLQLGWEGDVGMIAFKVIQNVESGKSMRVWDRDLLEFALKNITEDLLAADRAVGRVVLNNKKGHIIVMGCINNYTDWLMLGQKIQDKMETLLEKTIIVEQQSAESIEELPTLYRSLMKELGSKGSLSPIVILTKKFIDRNYYMPTLTLGDVASGVQVSPTYLSKQLKRELGLSFIDYLTEVRIRKAIQLMCDPMFKVYEIAEKVGYSSQHYFSSAFKKVTGTSPIVYKKGIRS